MAPKILISQPKPQTAKSPYFDIAEKYGVDMVFRPFIKIEKMSAKDFRQQKVSIPGHTAIVFTSRHAIDHFFDLVKELRVIIKEDMKYFCKSEQVALYIQKYVQYRKRKVFFPTTGKVSDLIPIMEKHKTENYFVPQSSAHNDEMKNMLDAAGLKHDEAVMYYTVSNDFQPGEPFDYNMLVFFSPEGIHSLVKNFPNFDQGKVAIACLGQKTIEAAEEAGLRVDMKPTPELRSVPAIIEDFIKHHSKEEMAPKKAAASKKKPAAKKTADKKPSTTKKTTAKKA
jgi:uroporphyrinogen-III synthase